MEALLFSQKESSLHEKLFLSNAFNGRIRRKESSSVATISRHLDLKVKMDNGSHCTPDNEMIFSGCVSSTDGTHVILFQKPGLDGEVYYNRKCQYSMNVQLTFDHRRHIRYLVAGWPGSVHDTTAWESGAIFRTPTEYFSPGQYQFGDSGYRLTTYMITPYKQPAASRPENEEFNLRLSRGRVVSEHGNGVLKARWQSLRGLPICINQASHVRYACDWILACCVLHNMVNEVNMSEDQMEPFLEDNNARRHDSAVFHENTDANGWRKEIQAKVLQFWN